MINKNFENLLASIECASGDQNAFLPIVTVWLQTVYVNGTFNGFPNSVNNGFTLNANSAGISLGTGNTPPSKLDYNLESTITSGISVSVTSVERGIEFEDDSIEYKEYTLTVTNTGSDVLTIREIGYKQNITPVSYFPYNIVSNTSGNFIYLLDRTVLRTPLVIQPGDAGVLKYKLRTLPMIKVKNGVKLVSFTYGSDENVAAMIDAAKEGLIDLQEDGEWRIGDQRKIHINDWVSDNGSTQVGKDIIIAISEFGDYNNSGSLFQFDFMQCISNSGIRYNATNTNNFSSSEIYTVDIPNVLEALPTWLRTRLNTFDVFVGSGGASPVLETVRNNKLCPRAEVEIFGTHNSSIEGEGTQVSLYKYSIELRKRKVGLPGSVFDTNNSQYWWLRSPVKNNSSSYCLISSATAAGLTTNNATANSPYLVLFGCI